MGVSIEMMEISALPAPLRAQMASGGPLLFSDGYVYLIRGEKAFRCEDTPDGRDTLGALSGAETEAEPVSAEDAIRVILDGCAPERALDLAKRFHIRPEGKRFIATLACWNRERRDQWKAIRSVAPMEVGDLLISRSPERTVLIKSGEDAQEMEEFVLALMDTVEGETGLRLEAGIGNLTVDCAGWAAGYREAEVALKTGRACRMKGPVYVYRKQLLERLLSEIPPETRKRYLREVFGEDIRKTLSGDTMETVDMFFDSDLNLSDTARQMFIHRNTLTYRLDKIRKETGLDLRRFRDAVIFRVLTNLPDEEKKG